MLFHGRLLEIPGGWGVQRCKFPGGVGGEKSNIFPEGLRALSEGNLSISHLRFDRSTDRRAPVYSNAICTFSGHF